MMSPSNVRRSPVARENSPVARENKGQYIPSKTT